MQRFRVIDGLRFWMAWWVVAGHMMQVTGARLFLPAPLATFIGHGNWAVQVFMIVSGFVIAHVLLSRQDDYRSYITQRLLRLYPLYAFAIAAALLVSRWDATVWANAPWIEDPARALDRIASERAYPLVHGVLHLLLLHGVVPDDRLAFASSAFLPPAWSLSVEWQFYLVAPLILWALIKRSPLSYWLIATGMLTSMFTKFGSFAWWQYLSFLPNALPFFVIGVASQLVMRRQASFIAISTGIIAIVIAAFAPDRNQAAGVPLILGIWLFFMLLAWSDTDDAPNWTRRTRTLARAIGGNRAFVYLGQISYSTYLIHVPILTLMLGSGTAVMGTPVQSISILLALAAVPTIIAASALLYHFVELPGIALGRRLAARPSA